MKKLIILLAVLLIAIQLFGWGQRQATIFTQAWLSITDSLLISGNIKLDNSVSIQARNNADSAYDNLFNYNSSDEIEFEQPVSLGSIQGVTDGGMQILANVPVSASATVDAEEGWYVSVGSTPVFTVKGEALDAGGVDAITTISYGGRIENITTVNAATYDVLPSDYILNVTYTDTGTVAIDLKTAQLVAGRVIIIKDSDLNANTNNITISTEGAETIDESATYVMDADGESINIFCDGTNWFIF